MSNYKGEDRLEKFYTPPELSSELFSLLDRFHKEPISEYLETSAGDGKLIDLFDGPYIAFDIKNETNRPDIKECDYLKEKIEYKKGRVCVMNPPFQKGLKFLNKALKESDYVVSILSQNSLLNIDYTKVWCDEIQLWRKYDFGSCKVGLILVACRKKTEEDKYEYD